MAQSVRHIVHLAAAIVCAATATSISACTSSIGGGPGSMQVADNDMHSMRFDLSTSKVSQKTTSRHSMANAQRAYADLGIPLTTRREEDHILGNEGMNVSHTLDKRPLSTFLGCGTGSGGPNADLYAVHMSVVTQLTPMRDSTVQIATLVTADATSRLYGNVAATCATTGELEKDISNRINLLP